MNNDYISHPLTLINTVSNLKKQGINSFAKIGVGVVKHYAYGMAAEVICDEIATISKENGGERILDYLKEVTGTDFTKDTAKKYLDNVCKGTAITAINSVEQKAVEKGVRNKAKSKYKKYVKECNNKHKKPISEENWRIKYNNLKKARAAKAEKKKTNVKRAAKAEKKKANVKPNVKPTEKERAAKEETFQIFVKDCNSGTCTISVNGDMYTAELGKVITEKLGVPYEDLRIIHNGKQLHDDGSTLSDYNLEKESTIQLSLRLRGGTGPRNNPHFYDNVIKDIQKELNRNHNIYAEIVMRKDLDFHIKNQLKARIAKLSRTHDGIVYFDDKELEFAGKRNYKGEFWNHRKAIIITAEKRKKNSNLLNIKTKNLRDDVRNYPSYYSNEYKDQLIKDSKISVDITGSVLEDVRRIETISRNTNKIMKQEKYANGKYRYTNAQIREVIEHNQVGLLNGNILTRDYPVLTRQISIQEFENTQI